MGQMWIKRGVSPATDHVAFLTMLFEGGVLPDGIISDRPSAVAAAIADGHAQPNRWQGVVLF